MGRRPGDDHGTAVVFVGDDLDDRPDAEPVADPAGTSAWSRRGAHRRRLTVGVCLLALIVAVFAVARLRGAHDGRPSLLPDADTAPVSLDASGHVRNCPSYTACALQLGLPGTVLEAVRDDVRGATVTTSSTVLSWLDNAPFPNVLLRHVSLAVDGRKVDVAVRAARFTDPRTTQVTRSGGGTVGTVAVRLGSFVVTATERASRAQLDADGDQLFRLAHDERLLSD